MVHATLDVNMGLNIKVAYFNLDIANFGVFSENNNFNMFTEDSIVALPIRFE